MDWINGGLVEFQSAVHQRSEMATKSKDVIYTLPEQAIALKPKERYAGIVLNKDGSPSHHLILLPQKLKTAVQWEEAKEWAASIDGELPTRQEQSLLFANLKDQFTPNWHWSSEAFGFSNAWFQNFGHGNQDSGNVNGGCHARAVRRLAI